MTASARPRSSLWNYRSLIWNFAQRDLKSRFKGTALGWTWSLMLPLATLATYSLVFSVIFRATPPNFGNGSAGFFPIWLWCGLIPWSFFMTSVTIGMPTLLANGPMLQKVYFPSYAPVLGGALAILVQSAIEISILGVVLLFLGNVGPTWLLLPLWAVLFVAFVAPAAVALAVMNVYFRDLAHLTNVVLQLLFYLTPIIYPVGLVPTSWHRIPLQTIVEINPLALYVEGLRSLIYDLRVPDPWVWVGMLAWAALSLAVAYQVYRSRGLDIGESI